MNKVFDSQLIFGGNEATMKRLTAFLKKKKREPLLWDKQEPRSSGHQTLKTKRRAATLA